MRILWASNSPWAASGYGVQTAMITPRLRALGHDVAIASNYGTQACVLGYGDIPVYPQGGEDHSIEITHHHADHYNADVILTHYDAWVYKTELFKRPWVPWFPVDCDELQGPVEANIKHAKLRVTQTRHGQAACEARGLSCEYVPASFNPDEYYPASGAEWRRGAGIAEDAFLVTMIAANKGAPGAPNRKSFHQAFEGFALFAKQHPEARLYVHTVMQGHIDLAGYAAHLGIADKVTFAHPYPIVSGLVTATDMRTIYSASDVLLSPSMGEGFGVPIIEAQACGVPVITGDWTSMSEVTRTGLAIPKSEATRYPLQGPIGVYGVMFIVRPEAVRDALLEAVTWKHDPAVVSDRVAEYRVDHVFAKHWVPVVEKVAEALAPAPAQLAAAERRARRAEKRRRVTGAPAVA